MVPPRRRMPVTSRASAAATRRVEQAVEAVFEADDLDAGVEADLTTARMTALRPGASPPPVSTPIRLIGGTIRDYMGKAQRFNFGCKFDTVKGYRPVGRLAQLGERSVRNAEVGSSILLPSTTNLRESPSRLVMASGWQARVVLRSAQHGVSQASVYEGSVHVPALRATPPVGTPCRLQPDRRSRSRTTMGSMQSLLISAA